MSDQTVQELIATIRGRYVKYGTLHQHYLTVSEADIIFDAFDALEAKNARLVEALEYWQSAHKTGRYEPTSVAFDNAQRVLDDTALQQETAHGEG